MSYYDILEIPNDATMPCIKKKYRRLALIYHPDKNNDKLASNDKFIKITEAYTILSNPETRRQYDLKQDLYESNSDSFKDILNPFLKSIGLDSIKSQFDTFSKLIELDTDLANKIFEKTLEDLYAHITNNNKDNNKDNNNKNNNKNNQNNLLKSQYRKLTIEYELEEHYRGDFTKIIKLTVDNLIHEIEVNTSKYKSTIEVVLSNTIYILDIYCIALSNEIFTPTSKQGNLYHIITINHNAFINGFHYNLDIFGNIHKIFFKTPYKTNMIYKVDNIGNIIYNTNKRGAVIFIIKLETPSELEMNNIKVLKLNRKSEYFEAMIVAYNDLSC